MFSINQSRYNGYYYTITSRLMENAYPVMLQEIIILPNNQIQIAVIVEVTLQDFSSVKVEIRVLENFPSVKNDFNA